jgi:hypothetical protein
LEPLDWRHGGGSKKQSQLLALPTQEMTLNDLSLNPNLVGRKAIVKKTLTKNKAQIERAWNFNTFIGAREKSVLLRARCRSGLTGSCASCGCHRSASIEHPSLQLTALHLTANNQGKETTLCARSGYAPCLLPISAELKASHRATTDVDSSKD